MPERLQHILTVVCLWSLFATGLVFCCVALRPAAAEVSDVWRKLTRTGRVVFGVFALCMVLYGGGKTNAIPQRIPASLRSSTQKVRTPTDAEKMAANWNARGAWADSFRLDFGDDWVFPWGTNHLSGVEVISQGAVWPAWNDTNAVASIGVPVAIVPGLTEFAWEHTPSNTYRLSWTDAAVGRDTNHLITASVELFRCGDVAVTTNGVTTTAPRILPFEPCEAQDEAWVDGQVGASLTNGLYKFTATFPDDPPEAIQLKVGERSLAVTNAGVYAFLLEKGVEYEYGTIPFQPGVAYAAVDDVPSATPRLLAAGAASETGTREWTVDGGYSNAPQTSSALGRVAWWPQFCGSPGVTHIGPDDSPFEFTAVLSDWCRTNDVVSFRWSASEGLTVASPNAQTTEVTVDEMPSWAEASISVTATLGGHDLTSTLGNLTYGTNDTPQVHLSLSVPGRLIVRDAWMSGSVSASASAAFHSDIPTNGQFFVWLEGATTKVFVSPSLPRQAEVSDANALSCSFTIDGIETSECECDVVVRCAFVDEKGVTNSCGVATTVIRPTIVSVNNAPDTGVCVVKGESVGVRLMTEPVLTGSLDTQWMTAKRRTRSGYDPWAMRGTGSPDATLTMGEAGVFALAARTVCGCQSNQVEYVHARSEPALPAFKENELGPNMAGGRNHLGVASTKKLLAIRNSALGHLNMAEYGKYMSLGARNGFSKISNGDWKCNAFVADMAIAAGVNVPVQHTIPHPWPMPDKYYPPVANEWARGTVAISGWVHLGSTAYPEPGFIVGHPAANGPGHCGIVDYDGWTISARRYGISRKATSMLDGTCGYNKPEDEINE